ncbi:MAG TPA: ParB/RepB/Spo0J family partition protein [Nitrospirales bacterium]
MQKKALGRGLGTLIPVSRAPLSGHDHTEQIIHLALSAIALNPYQPRRVFDNEALRELAESFKTKGIIQPILVRRLGDGQFQLIAGERRLRAAKLAGLEKIPAIVRTATDAESMEIALIENLQRKDLNPIEAARAFQRLMKEFGLTQEELSARIAKERSSIANTVRLLSLPSEVQAWVEEAQLSLGHAKVLMALTNPDEQIRLASKVVKERLSVRDLERLITSAQAVKARRGGSSGMSPVEEQLKRKLGTKVRLLEGKVGGKIIIEYYSSGELDRLVDVILG